MKPRLHPTVQAAEASVPGARTPRCQARTPGEVREDVVPQEKPTRRR